jgi:hypothetical protein
MYTVQLCTAHIALHVALYASLFAQIDCTVLDKLGWGFKTGCKQTQRVPMNDTELRVYVPNRKFQ